MNKEIILTEDAINIVLCVNGKRYGGHINLSEEIVSKADKDEFLKTWSPTLWEAVIKYKNEKR